ncbi:helix-turn-helix domain-containing protein [Mesorhizobium sp. KR9-304]|uniref:helix-turn-helix domain-containing protein n=1 Tax=Mesorhizobium sp. KR9-304 TaxID=3156614 RepID=UPI0032B3913A
MTPDQRKGRPSTFRPEAVQLAETGITQPEIAEALGTTNRTISRWALQYQEFRAALDRGLARREAERRLAETAPLREAASKLRRMIADALAFDGAWEGPKDRGSAAGTLDGALTSTTRMLSRPRLAQARRERQIIRYSLSDPEPDLAFDCDPVELLDPRSDC